MPQSRPGGGKRPVRPAIREIIEPADPAVAKAHRLLRRTFRKAELVGVREWRNSLREREAGLWSDIRWHLVVAENDSAVVGVASGTYLGNVNTGVIGYLGVSPTARGAAVGPRLRKKLHALFRRDARVICGRPLEAVVGEVRRENPWLRTLVRRERVLALDFDYFQPRLHSGDRPVPLVLYYESLDRQRRRVSASLIRKLLYTIWRRIYRIPQPLSNPGFRRMIRTLERRSSVGSLTLGDIPARVTDPSR